MVEPDKDVRAEVIVNGQVQGVWFRAAAVEMARSLHVRGWVKNRRDGSVEAIFEGPSDPVQQAVAWCHHGPQLAQVERVDVRWKDATGEFAAFTVAF